MPSGLTRGWLRASQFPAMVEALYLFRPDPHHYDNGIIRLHPPPYPDARAACPGNDPAVAVDAAWY
jgi:hypothetical protein